MKAGGDGGVVGNVLRVTYVTVDGEEMMLLSYPVAPLRAPTGLTRAEGDVAIAFAKGQSMRAIAAMRGTATRTVANQMRAIYAKLGVQSRADLAARLGE
jgi:DNA-binding NarL/FixJ family response regulator